MERSANDILPAFPTHPGSILRDELEARGITQKAFAATIDMKASNLSELIHGKRNVTVAIAMKLEEALGIRFSTWINLQSRHDYVVAKKKEQALKAKATLPVPYSANAWQSTAQYAQEP